MRSTILSTLFLSGLAWGQGRTELRATLGRATFLDESLQHHLAAGGSFRYYLNRRLSLGPEFLYMRQSKADQDFEFAPTLAVDLARPGARVSPYLIGGVGIEWRRQLTGTGYYTARTVAASVGFGAKIFLTSRLFVAPEGRFGVEPLFRITGSLGWVLKP